LSATNGNKITSVTLNGPKKLSRSFNMRSLPAQTSITEYPQPPY